MLIAQITDMHIKPAGRLVYGRVDTAPYLRAAVAALLALDPAPDLVLATGDLVDVGEPEEYARLRDILAPLDKRLLVVPGNHDRREALLAAFAHHDYLPRTGFVQYVVEDHPVRLIALDTLVPGQGGGALCAERLDWLAARLAEDRRRPTVIFMHHPPFMTGIESMDGRGFDGVDALAALVRGQDNIERILCGHLHRPIQARFAGTIASTAPATGHQITLDLIPGSPLSFVMEPPGYQLHLLRPGQGIVSHTAVVGSFEGPFPTRSRARGQQAFPTAAS